MACLVRAGTGAVSVKPQASMPIVWHANTGAIFGRHVRRRAGGAGCHATIRSRAGFESLTANDNKRREAGWRVNGADLLLYLAAGAAIYGTYRFEKRRRGEK